MLGFRPISGILTDFPSEYIKSVAAFDDHSEVAVTVTSQV